jgi:hypothetical protein
MQLEITKFENVTPAKWRSWKSKPTSVYRLQWVASDSNPRAHTTLQWLFRLLFPEWIHSNPC